MADNSCVPDYFRLADDTSKIHLSYNSALGDREIRGSQGKGIRLDESVMALGFA